MTDKLYLNDSYVREITSRITGVEGNTLRLEKTIFYPTGGGQPSDSGELISNGLKARIQEARKNGDEVDHVLESPSPLSPGDEVTLSLDWEKRYAHMKFHTAIHIIDAAVHRMDRPDIIITGSQIYDDHARVDFDFEKLDQDSAQSIIDAANAIVEGRHNVNIREMSQEEALSIDGLARTEPGRKLLMSLDRIRIIEIEGIDMQADGGTHVANTSEVGRISLNRIQSKGRHNKRMEISLE